MRVSSALNMRQCVRLLNATNGLAPPSDTKFIEYADVHHITGRSRPSDPSLYKSCDFYKHTKFSYYKYEVDMLKKRTIEQPKTNVPDAPRTCIGDEAPKK